MEDAAAEAAGAAAAIAVDPLQIAELTEAERLPLLRASSRAANTCHGSTAAARTGSSFRRARPVFTSSNCSGSSHSPTWRPRAAQYSTCWAALRFLLEPHGRDGFRHCRASGPVIRYL